MTSEEIQSTFRELAEIVTTSGLGWILSQVDETVRGGHAVEKPTKIFKEEEQETVFSFNAEQQAPRRGGKPTALMTLEPWPERDQLLFLIDAIRQAVIHAAAVENEQLRLLRSTADVEGVSFMPEGEVTDRGAFRSTGAHDERVHALARMLNELEREVRS